MGYLYLYLFEIADIEKMTANKKRKERDDDNCGKISKVHNNNTNEYISELIMVCNWNFNL